MKTATKKATKTPRPVTADQPSAEASARFKRLVAGGRRAGKQTTEPAPAATSATDATPPSADAVIPATVVDAPAFTTLKDLGATWIESLKANGAAVSTWASYQHDFETAVEHFGGTTDPATLTPDAVAAYEASPAVTTTKKGRPKSKPTILKTRRVLRFALTWARDAGRLAAIPYAPKAAS